MCPEFALNYVTIIPPGTITVQGTVNILDQDPNCKSKENMTSKTQIQLACVLPGFGILDSTTNSPKHDG